MDTKKAADMVADFAIPFAEACQKLRHSADNDIGVTLTAKQVKGLMQGLQALNDGRKS